MNKTMQTQPSRDAIAERAYQIWEAAGRPSGRDKEHWRQAEAECLALKHQPKVKFASPNANVDQKPALLRPFEPAGRNFQSPSLKGRRA
jgi:hypothetical protein